MKFLEMFLFGVVGGSPLGYGFWLYQQLSF